MRRILWLFIIFTLFGLQNVDGKKIKQSLSIGKEQKADLSKETGKINGKKVELSDSILVNGSGLSDLLMVKFAGYDKEINSSKESFILINNSNNIITGYEVKIDYLDSHGRMLHSRNIRESGIVPPGETRRFDIKSWDTQHTYYYYLGNEPKKVATPYQVSFTPLIFWIEE